MTTPSPENFNSDPQLCTQCRGLCCQGHPGVWVNPERFFALFSPKIKPDMTQLLERLAVLGFELRDLGGVPVPAPVGTEHGCSFLGPSGCRLDQGVRPCQCLALEPSLETLVTGENHCHLPAEAGSGMARNNWRTYWKTKKSPGSLEGGDSRGQ